MTTWRATENTPQGKPGKTASVEREIPTSDAARYEKLHRIGIALSAERNPARLLEMILSEAQALCNADGGTLYLRTDDDHLKFEIVSNRSLGISLGGTADAAVDFPPLPLFDRNGHPNRRNVASYAVHEKRPVHVPDAYHAEGFDFSGTKVFDERSGYRSKSFLTIPLINGEDQVIGVLQLINALEPSSKEVIPFETSLQQSVEALASQAALALDNRLLLEAQKELLESFIKLIAAAIDSKSPYTGGHCERVPVLTQMIVDALCRTDQGPFSQFNLSDDEWYELKIAAWLHDCGKVTTPVHVMDKATKLETIFDRIQLVRHRFEILKRDARIEMLEECRSGGDSERAEARYQERLQELNEELAVIERANIGGEFLGEDAKQEIRRIGSRKFVDNGQERPLLSEEELENLCIAKGTLTHDERLVINGHMVQTIRMLEALPFPRNLQRVPEYAGGHHEKMDGSGYPRGVYAGDMSVPARAMAIADVFEALTASDRPYKPAKKLSEAMRIMGFMKRDNHLDPRLFDEFVKSGVYRTYAQKFLTPDLIDEVDEQALLDIEPKAFSLPPAEVRNQRKERLLEEYEERFPERATQLPGT